MDIKNSLNALVLNRLGADEEIKNLKIWYDKCIDAPVRYVVFVVRRCYLLALLMEALQADETRKMIDNRNKSYVTDAAFLSCCEELAAYYRQCQAFPKIMLCDDQLIHGRNLNRVIENVERRLHELLPEVELQKVKDALSAAIQIRVFCFARNDHLLLKTNYMQDATYELKYQPVKWRELSSRISTLVTESGIANASYINSELIDASECERIVKGENSGFRQRFFQNVSGYTKVKLLRDHAGLVYAIYTIRILKNKFDDKYRVIPFVFMPNLDDSETLHLFDAIKTAGISKKWGEGFFEQMLAFYRVNGKRTFNEWLTLIISQAVLKEFNDQYGICLGTHGQNGDENGKGDRGYQAEIQKLARNYRFDQTDRHVMYLEACIQNPILSSTGELDEILLPHLINRPMFALGDRQVSETNIRRSFENYFYERGSAEELDAVQYDGDPSRQCSVDRSMVRGCCFILRELLNQASYDSVCYGISSLLFMMDAGVLGVSSHAARNTNVVGYAQFAKAGELSLLIRPLRYMEYIPFLTIAQDWCRQFSRDYIEHLRRYARAESCDIPLGTMQKLIDFIQGIGEIEEKISDWNGAYYERIEYVPEFDRSDNNAYVRGQYDFEQRKNSHVECYKQFMLAYTQELYH